jgi:hypothetical protein
MILATDTLHRIRPNDTTIFEIRGEGAAEVIARSRGVGELGCNDFVMFLTTPATHP